MRSAMGNKHCCNIYPSSVETLDFVWRPLFSLAITILGIVRVRNIFLFLFFFLLCGGRCCAHIGC